MTLAADLSRIATLGALALLFVATAALGADSGRELYFRYCASCHGPEGRGDGPDAAMFSAPPRNLRQGFIKKYSVGQLVRRVVNGTALELLVDPEALQAHAGEVEALAAHLSRLPDVDWALVGAGWDIYEARCAACHGSYGSAGTPVAGGANRLRDLADPQFQKSFKDRELMDLVRHGREHMPALVPRVPQSAAAPLVAFVRLLSPGFRLYSRYCANCHGDDGLASGQPPGSMQVPSVPFDRAYLARTDAEQLRASIWHMLREKKPAMPHYRWRIDKAQARAIVIYLKGL